MKQYLLLVFLLCSVAYCDKVVKLVGSNFKEQLSNEPVALVKFFAPWCGHCKRLAPAFIEAAEILSQQSPKVTLFEVDCTVEKDLCSEHGISGYPTLKIFKNGEYDRDYDGPREAKDMAHYLLARVRPASTEFKTLQELESFISENKPSLIAYIKSSDIPFMKDYLKLASDMIDHVVIGHTHANILEAQSDYLVRLYLPKEIRSKLEPDFIIYSGKPSISELKDWIQKHGHGLVGYRKTSDHFFYPESNLVVIYGEHSLQSYASGVKYLRNRLLKAIQSHKDHFEDLKFAYSSADEFYQEIPEFGLDSAFKKPVVRIRSATGKKYRLTNYDPDSFIDFLYKFRNGSLTPFVKSESVESEAKPVKKVVALNFDEIVNDPTKDVLIVFHAPWCGHCKSLMPKFEKAADQLANEPSLILAAMDATANDIPSGYEVTGFPTLYFVPKDKKSSPTPYTGGRETDEIIKYLAASSTEELRGYDRSGNPKKQEL